jgi:hypothetical protein
MGAPKYTVPRPSKGVTELIEQALARGERPAKIAARLGVTAETVAQVVEDMAYVALPVSHVMTGHRPGEQPHTDARGCWCRPVVAVTRDQVVVRHTGKPRPSVASSLRVEAGYEANRSYTPTQGGKPRGSRNEP